MGIYLDNAATTRMRPEALAAYVRQAEAVGNPSSVHSAGQDARFAVETARADVAASLGADAAEVIFTGGGTESINLAIKGLYWAAVARDPRRRVVVAPEGEHHATLDALEWLAEAQDAEVVWLPVDEDARVSPEALAALLTERPGEVALVTLVWANNEVGTIQPVAEVARVARSAGVPIHVDAVSAYGQIPIDFHAAGVSALSVSAHKIGGPVGVGAFVLQRSVAVSPLVHGGGQERRIHSGTLNAPGIAGFAAAARAMVDEVDAEAARLRGLRDSLIRGIAESIPEAIVTGDLGGDPSTAGRLPANVSVVLPGCEGDSLVFLLDRSGFQASNGSACTAGVAQPSHVLRAMGLSEQDSRSGLRVTLGHDTTVDDIQSLIAALPGVYAAARAAGMAAREPQTF